MLTIILTEHKGSNQPAETEAPAHLPRPSGERENANIESDRSLVNLKLYVCISIPFQAKANELQLLKHWGQAAATKRQTQMKYGF